MSKLVRFVGTGGHNYWETVLLENIHTTCKFSGVDGKW